MEVFATFDIIDSNNVRVAEGHKASFCLEDNECLPGVSPGYVCANFGDQGISVNCSDIYRYNIDCQWIDITELQPGLYTFKVRTVRSVAGILEWEVQDHEVFSKHEPSGGPEPKKPKEGSGGSSSENFDAKLWVLRRFRIWLHTPYDYIEKKKFTVIL